MDDFSGTIKVEEAEDNNQISLVPVSEIKNEPELLIHDTCEDSDSKDFSEDAYDQNVFEIKADIEDNESSGREFLTESESEFLTDSESEFQTEETMTTYKSHAFQRMPYKKFNCTICDEGFDAQLEIAKHLKAEHNVNIDKKTTKYQRNFNIIFICPVCNVELESNDAQMQHIDMEHQLNTTLKGLSMKEVVVCDENGAKVKKGYECLECGAQFSKISRPINRLEHRMSHLPYKPYICNRCGISFSYLPYFKKHLLKCNELKPTKCQINLNIMFMCPVCKVELKSKDAQMQHINKEHQVNTTNKGLSMKEIVIYDEKGTEVKKICECLECGAQLRNKSGAFERLEHRMLHLPYKPYKCKRCGIMLSHLKSIGKHSVKCNKLKKKWCPAPEDIDDNTANINLMFICPVCNVELESKNAQMQHIDMEHQLNTTLKGLSMKEVIYDQKEAKGKKVYECLECGAQLRNTSRPFHRLEHRMSHLPYKPYKCKLCKKPLSHLSNLDIHRLKCNKLKPASEDIYENNIIYICPVCNVELDALKAQRHHMNKEHQITLKGLSMKEVVIYDQKGAEVKVYECLECDAQLSIKSGPLRRLDHVMSHLQYRPYKCKRCRISFFNLQALREHLVKCKK